MLFNSFEFIFVFLPLCLLFYFGLNRFGQYKLAKGVLVLFSLYFYAFFNWSYLPIIITSILINYAISTGLKFSGEPLKRKILLSAGLLFNIGLLGYFKYYDFFISNMNIIFQSNFTLRHILLPLGISFFTFQQIAFVIDSYHRRVMMPSFLDYCNFVTFFPQLIAGPIVLPEEMLPQFEEKSNRTPNYKNIFDGIFIFGIGLAKKVIIADSIAVFANAGFDGDMVSYTFLEAWLISIAYTMQLYFDFSGYCDMAIGIGRMFNISLPLNFNIPYIAANFREFWRRWHMTLNRFLTQYLYIPLGGNRKGELRTHMNTMVVFGVSGLWHGAGWTFIIWGLLHGGGVIISKLWKNYGFKLPHVVAVGITFVCVNILWVIFRADSLGRAWLIIKSMFNNLSFKLTSDFTSNLPSIFPNKFNMALLAIAIILSLFGPSGYMLMTEYRKPRVKIVATAVLITCGIILLNRISTFLYFNF